METKKKGFASMNPARQREIAAMGGRVKCVKGFAAMTPERHSQIARMGGMSSKGGGRKAK